MKYFKTFLNYNEGLTWELMKAGFGFKTKYDKEQVNEPSDEVLSIFNKIKDVKDKVKNEGVSNDYFYLSLLDNHLKKYKLSNKDDRSFFHLLNKIREQGKMDLIIPLIFFTNNAIRDLTNEFQPLFSTNSLLTYYEVTLESKRYVGLEFKPAEEDEKTPKIFKSSITKSLSDYGIEELAKKDLRSAIYELLLCEYNDGRQQICSSFENNMKWLKEDLEKSRIDKLSKDLNKTLVKLKEYKNDIKING